MLPKHPRTVSKQKTRGVYCICKSKVQFWNEANVKITAESHCNFNDVCTTSSIDYIRRRKFNWKSSAVLNIYASLTVRVFAAFFMGIFHFVLQINLKKELIFSWWSCIRFFSVCKQVESVRMPKSQQTNFSSQT